MSNRPDAVWKYSPTAGTLGNSVVGGLPADILDAICLSKFTTVDHCTLLNLCAYLSIAGTAIKIRGLVYDEAYTKIAETAEITPVAGAPAWFTMTFSSPIQLEKGRTYWFGVWATGTGAAISGYKTTGTVGQFRTQNITYSSTAVPDPIVPGAATDYALAIYATLSKFVNLTDNSSEINFIATNPEIFYFGYSRRFIGFMTDLSTNGSYGDVVYEYLSTATTWKKLQRIDSYAFTESKYQRWNLPNDWARIEFSAGFPQSVDAPDDIERYWVRIHVMSVTTPAVVSKIRLVPYAQYTTPVKVSDFLEVKKSYDLTTRPSENVVEDMIRRAEDRIDYRTRKSWRFNAVTEETDPIRVDFGRSGMYLRHKNFYRVYSVKVWNGAAWNTLTEGRTGDYQIDYNLGMIYLTRTYVLPAVYGIAGRSTSYNVGEYKNSVQVDYVYGRDSETDAEFYNVEDLTIKMVAVDLLRHHDYSVNTVSGSDKVSYSEKIANLEAQIEAKLDELQGVYII